MAENDTTITEAFRAELASLSRDMADIQAEAGALSDTLAGDLRDALHAVATEGASFTDMLHAMALNLADQAFDSATRPVTDLLGNLISQGVGGGVSQMMGLPNITMNVQAGDADSFSRSQTQIAAALQRAIALGQRNM